MSNEKTITVNLDKVDLEREQGYGTGLPLVRIDILQGGKRMTVHIDLFKHELRPVPTLRMCAVNRHADVTRTVQVRPWAKDE